MRRFLTLSALAAAPSLILFGCAQISPNETDLAAGGTAATTPDDLDRARGIQLIPGPCCGNTNAGPSEDDVIRMHPGILSVGDLDPMDYGWTDPVAKVTVPRIR